MYGRTFEIRMQDTKTSINGTPVYTWDAYEIFKISTPSHIASGYADTMELCLERAMQALKIARTM